MKRKESFQRRKGNKNWGTKSSDKKIQKEEILDTNVLGKDKKKKNIIYILKLQLFLQFFNIFTTWIQLFQQFKNSFFIKFSCLGTWPVFHCILKFIVIKVMSCKPLHVSEEMRITCHQVRTFKGDDKKVPSELIDNILTGYQPGHSFLQTWGFSHSSSGLHLK